MTRWLHDLRDTLSGGEPACLVIVAEARGSTPREAGARMIVTAGGQSGTIGGGQLELEALGRARSRLAGGHRDHVVGLSLGPELSQCCGGSVTLLLEPFAPADLAWLDRLIAAQNSPQPLLRTITVDEAGRLSRTASIDSDWPGQPDGETGFECRRDGAVLHVIERLSRNRRAVWLFGAGHVGQAVARALAPLDYDLTWVDGRAGMFPDDCPANVRTLELAMPELIVDEAPPGAVYLVMTHSHPLDQDVCEAVLRRDDAAYLGLIGSATKRAKFVRRLREQGLDEETLARLTCPIGLPRISGKQPEVIAASVAADLLMRFPHAREARDYSALQRGDTT